FTKPFHASALRTHVLGALGIEEAAPGHAEPAPAAAPLPLCELAGRPPEVALVDGDETIYEDVLSIVRDAVGQEARTTQHRLGMPALQALQKDPPDLVLIDLRLPDMHGLNFLKLMKRSSKLKDVPVIVLTANAHP